MAAEWTHADWKRQRRYEQRSSRQCMAYMMCLVILGVLLSLFYFDIIDSSKIENIPVLGDIDFGNDDFVDIDPFGGELNVTDSSMVYAWENGGHGLQLEVLNALDQYWLSAFVSAIRNWENGNPDALSLVTTKVDYDLECEIEENRLKVCNGNYGKTRWRGINEVLLNRRQTTIYASAARMNDFYLIHADEGERLYTMCHELGHGFGLPHWDEDLYNKDLGNCMDYTDEPEKNATPNESNFRYLARLYGETRRQLRGQSDAEATTKNSEVPDTSRSPLPDWVLPAYNEARQNFDYLSTNVEGTKWRMLHSNEYGQAHEVDLGEGYVAQIHMLTVPN